MRLIHETHYDVLFFGVLGCQVTPQAGEVFILGSTLANDLSIPAGVVMDVNDTMGAGGQARLHQVIVFREISGVKLATEFVADEVLPAYGQPESIQAVVLDEVFHLASAVLTLVLVQWSNDFGEITCSLQRPLTDAPRSLLYVDSH